MIPNWFKTPLPMCWVFVRKAFERGCKVNLALLRMISKLLFFVWSAHVRGLLSFWKAGGMRQSEAHWLRSLLSVHSSSPSVGGHTEGPVHTHKDAHTNTAMHTLRFQAAYAVFTIRELGWKSRLPWSWNWRVVCVCVGVCVCDFVFAPAKWSLNLAYRLFGGYTSSDYISCPLTSACCSYVCQARKCWTFHLCCVLTPCRRTMLELYSNRELNLHVYLVVEMEGIISTLWCYLWYFIDGDGEMFLLYLLSECQSAGLVTE